MALTNLRHSDKRQRRHGFARPQLELLEDRLEPGSLLLGQPWDFSVLNLMKPNPGSLSSGDEAQALHFRPSTGYAHSTPSHAAAAVLLAGGERAERGAVAPPAISLARDSAPLIPNEWLALSATKQVSQSFSNRQPLAEVQPNIALISSQTQLSAIPTHVQHHPGGNASSNWATYVTGTSTTATGQAVTQDSAGNTYVTGSTDEATTKGTFIAKYDSTGTQIFYKKFQAKDASTGIVYNHSEGRAIGLDGNGNIYVTGRATNPVTRLQDAFTMRFDNTGKADPTYGIGFDTGGLGNVTGNGMAVAPDGTATIVGTARFLGNDIFMAVILPDGSVSVNATHAFAPGSFVDLQGQQVFTGTVGNAVALSADGSVAYISGTGTQPGGHTDIMVMKVDTNSGGQSSAGFSYIQDPGNDSGNGLVLGADGTVYQAATATVQSGGRSNTYAGVIAWNASLSTTSYAVYDDVNTTTGTGIAVDPSGNVYVTGTGTDILGNTRAVVDLLDPTGAVADSLLFVDSGSGQEFGTGIVYSQDGTVYLTGATSSSNMPVSDNSALNGDQDAFLANIGGFMF
jgi:hypothetical protein